MSKIRVLAPLAVLSVVVLIVLSPLPALADHDRGHDHGRPGWGRGDIRYFPRYDADIWRGGRWYHGGYGDRFGWWWIVAGTWYSYPGPIYPYPNPYIPPVIMNPYPAAPGPAPTEYWYYCRAAKGYYPYVPTCPGGWEKVPATPPPGTPPG